MYILLVEDQPGTVQAIQKGLAEQNLKVDVAFDGKDRRESGIGKSL
jgi:DNA-binding response OmpR family regulator